MQQELLTILTGLLPISEIRGAIPLGVGFGFPIEKAYFLGLIGNLLPVIPVLFVLKKFSDLLMRKWYLFNRFMTWLYSRFQNKHSEHFTKFNWKFLALMIFVAIPFPLTGAWSGIIASHVLGMPFWKSVLAIALGVVISGIAVSLLVSFGVMAFQAVS